MDRQQEFVLRTIEERDIRFVRLWFTDVLGTLKSVAIAPAELEGAFTEGIGFDGSVIEGFARVYRGGHVGHPDPSTFQILPWRGRTPGTARMFCDITCPTARQHGGPTSRTPARAGQGRGPRLAASTCIRDRFFLLKDEPGSGRGPCPDRQRRLFRPRAARHGPRLPSCGDHHARVHGHLCRVQPPRGRAGPERIDLRYADALSMADNIDLPHRRQGGGVGAKASTRPSCPSRSLTTPAPACTPTSPSSRGPQRLP